MKKENDRVNWILSFILSAIPYVGVVELILLNRKRRKGFGIIIAILSIIAITMLTVALILTFAKRAGSENAFLSWYFNPAQNSIRRGIIIAAWLLPVVGTVLHGLDAVREKGNDRLQ